jgi:MoxR-like ATPase
MATDKQPNIETVISREDLLRARDTADMIYVDEKIKNYIVEIVMATREPKEHGLAQLLPLIQVGASPRATISLTRAGKAHAFLRGRGYVTADDVKSIAYHVLRHRLILTYEAEAENMTTDGVIKEILSTVEVP